MLVRVILEAIETDGILELPPEVRQTIKTLFAVR